MKILAVFVAIVIVLAAQPAQLKGAPYNEEAVAKLQGIGLIVCALIIYNASCTHTRRFVCTPFHNDRLWWLERERGQAG